ncbi:acetyl-coenzyme A carboxylase carboxyl transferase subunit beta [Tistrella bauzanensis]|uniref:Acetyl-coenzyme A carboxylase carboxyl transferase subunit beta n=1 Tax=Tistrella bauzanensis TaxID=657419 RepID=A0ABQ1ICV0_9PROT|nr:acetyl-CoA carboxylase, carboxyltransferase subunit beta [Tistrella bauzanensis]GGB34379.1 acetyl-coenzyme A carboxylase carboxyl transferase subunit beta [Tistrella bauzanensis]
MSWLSNFVRPKIQALVRKPETPDNLWHKCPSCEQMIFHRDLVENLHVCTHCGHHMRLPAKQRLAMLFDDGAYDRIDTPKVTADPLRFRDRKRYTDRLREAQAKTDEADAIQVGEGRIGGVPAVCAVFDFEFLGGSMGLGVGEGLVKAAAVAVQKKRPLIVFPASGGARMQEGALSLMQMARTTVAVDRVKEAGLPYIVVFTDPTTGGVTASFAMIGDIHISEPGALIGFAGQRVIESTIREALPQGFQRAEYLMEHGMLDMVVPRKELKATLARTLKLLLKLPHVAPRPGTAIDQPERASGSVTTRTVTPSKVPSGKDAMAKPGPAATKPVPAGQAEGKPADGKAVARAETAPAAPAPADPKAG